MCSPWGPDGSNLVATGQLGAVPFPQRTVSRMFPIRLARPTEATPQAGRHPGLAWWALAALLVAAGWLVTPNPVTIYDGVGQPDEPYRYVSAQPGARVTAKPTGAQTTVPVLAGVSGQDVTLLSTENAPQVSVFLPRDGLAATSGMISVSVVPEAPTDQPPEGRIDGNVYLLSITNTAGPVTFTANATNALIILRATSALSEPVIEHRSGPGQKWSAVETTRFGNDRYMGLIPAAGQYALVLQNPTPGGSGSGAGSHTALIVILLGALILLLSAVVAVRWHAEEVPG
jgi:hypothetical protein